MGEFFGDNGEEVTRGFDGTCVGTVWEVEAAKSLRVSSRATFLEVGGADWDVTPSAQLRARRVMTTELRRAAGEGWRKRWKEGASEAWKVEEDNGGGEDTNDVRDLSEE
jgi:hypothetical protein